MPQITSIFEQLPILGCLRDRAGRVLAVTDRLLEFDGRRRRDIVGKPLLQLWPQSKPWLALDRAALKAAAPLVRLEFSAGRWIRSTRIPERGRVWWMAEDVTD